MLPSRYRNNDFSSIFCSFSSSVAKVLEELGIEMSNEMAGAPQPSGPLGAGAGAARNRALAADGGPGLPSVDGSGVGSNADTIDEDDLEARLARLKRG